MANQKWTNYVDAIKSCWICIEFFLPTYYACHKCQKIHSKVCKLIEHNEDSAIIFTYHLKNVWRIRSLSVLKLFTSIEIETIFNRVARQHPKFIRKTKQNTQPFLFIRKWWFVINLDSTYDLHTGQNIWKKNLLTISNFLIQMPKMYIINTPNTRMTFYVNQSWFSLDFFLAFCFAYLELSRTSFFANYGRRSVCHWSQIFRTTWILWPAFRYLGRWKSRTVI